MFDTILTESDILSNTAEKTSWIPVSWISNLSFLGSHELEGVGNK